MSIVLALASVAAQNVVGRFGSRTLRLYLRRSMDRWLLGSFTLASAFIMSEQFQLRKLDPDGPAPAAGVIISIILLVVVATMLIAYISSFVRWFRVDRTTAVLRRAVLGAAHSIVRTGRAGGAPARIPERPSTATDLLAPRSGHLAEIDADSLLELCRPLDAVAVITETLGAAVVADQPIGWIARPEATIESIRVSEIAEAIDVSATRELGQNMEYGIVALVDVAIIALSPAVNDPNTAVEIIEEMGSLFRQIAPQTLGPYAVPHGDERPRVVVMARTFGQLVELATTQIVLYGLSDPMVRRALRRLADSLQLLDLTDEDRRPVDDFVAKLTLRSGDGAESG